MSENICVMCKGLYNMNDITYEQRLVVDEAFCPICWHREITAYSDDDMDFSFLEGLVKWCQVTPLGIDCKSYQPLCVVDLFHISILSLISETLQNLVSWIGFGTVGTLKVFMSSGQNADIITITNMEQYVEKEQRIELLHRAVLFWLC